MNDPVNDPLAQLQSDALNWLLGNPATLAVPYTSFRREVIQSAADEAAAAWKIRKAGSVGLACLVLMPSARLRTPNVPGPQFAVQLTVRTFEDPKVNNTGLTAESVAIANCNWLNEFMIEDLTQLYGAEQEEVVRANYDYPGFLVYDTIMMGELPQDYPGRTADLTIDEVSGLVTLADPDPAAAIYYTVDGSLPTPGAPSDGNAATQVYAAPFQVPLPTIVRAIAWNPAFLPSHCAKGTITS